MGGSVMQERFEIFTVLFCMVIPFIPFTFYLLHGFTYEYGRWQICLVLIALIFSCPFERAVSNCWLPAIIFGGYCTYIMNEEERKRIARNGHQKVAAQHTYLQRVGQILEIVDEFWK